MIRKALPAFLLAGLWAVAGLASAATVEKPITHRIPVKAGQTVDIENLAGAVVLTGSSGKDLVVEARVVAGEDDEASARRLADLIRLEPRVTGDRVLLHTGYPLDEYRDYQYSVDRSRGWGWNTQTEYQGRRVHIGSRGVDLHVDFKVTVPKGVALRFKNVVGTVDVTGVEADLTLDTSSGAITTKDTRGRLGADTGSGAVRVDGHTGYINADTGSGGITVVRLDGDLHADTGSGGVRVRDSKGKVWNLDTGSGGVDVDDSTVEEVDADTGSGGITMRGVTGIRRLKADAGSGSVKLEGDFSTLRDLDVDTGSGGLTLRTTAPLNLRIDADAGSGGVEVDLENLSNVRTSRREFTGTAGQGEGVARVSTGSGGIRIKDAH